MLLKPINQQVVAIMGASSGIGRLTAFMFAQKGAKVMVSARSEAGLKSLVSEIHLFGGEVDYVVADVSNIEQVKGFIEKTVARYGRLDTWVNAAATGVMGRFEDVTVEEFQRVIDVTLMGQVNGVTAALPYLKQQGGAIICVSSMEGRRSLPLQSAYSTAKHGLEGFLEALRVELMHEKVPVSVTSILPSVINTPYYNKIRTKLGVKPTGIPPYYQPNVVAEAIIYAAENPTRDFIAGDVGRVLDVLQRLSPGLIDTILATIGFVGQRTTEPKSEAAPDNLYEPIEGYDKIEGDFGQLTIPTFLDNLDKNPTLKWGLAAAVGAATILGLLPKDQV
ncbi:short-chain dehydrogenase/reductase SDR [Rivularia sp. IAM M-261]|nr:short-chain dehydrogenase/reductase SDR [Calothrix sp. PCC 7716]GJD18830.1 short-chain dehydrogenase/reductase SDR [Rivularia sp. IAM M-261]